MSVLSVIGRSPRGIYDVVDYPGLKPGTVIVTSRELKLADAGDQFTQEKICDRYAVSIGREGVEIEWRLLRKQMVFVAPVPRTHPGVPGMVHKLKLAAGKMG